MPDPTFANHSGACAVCDAPFSSVHKTRRYCSDACRYKAKTQASRSKPPVTCPTCGVMFPQRRGSVPALFCSQTCAMESRARPKPDPSSRIYVIRCKQCACSAVVRYPTARYCSDRCRLAHISDRIMGFYRTATAELDIPKAVAWRRKLTQYLADRDGCRCGICGRPVDLELPSGPRGNDDGASIDHVVPRSLGGTDDLANLRLTHWRCNRQRGNRGTTEQLRLVG